MIDSWLVEKIGWTLVHSIWQIALVAILFAIVTSLVKRRSADARYLAGCLALLALVVTPVATFFVMPTPDAPLNVDVVHSTSVPSTDRANVNELPIVQPQQDTEIAAAIEQQSGEVVNGSMEFPDSSERARTWNERVVEKVRPILPVLVAIWLCGILLLSLRPIIGLYAVRRLRQVGLSAVSNSIEEILRTTAARMKLRRSVEIAQSALAQVPAVVGYFRPLILLPASAVTGLGREQFEAVIAHELAHVRRHDYLVNLLQTAIETVLFYHPAVWWISRQVRRERENCCDDIVLRICDDVQYANALVAVEQLCGAVPQPALSARGGSLVQRIRRIIGRQSPAMHTRNPWIAFALTLCVVVLITLPIAIINAGDDQPNDATAPTDDFPKQVANQIAEVLGATKLPFLNEERLNSIQDDFEQFVADRQPEDLSDARKTAILKSIERNGVQHLISLAESSGNIYQPNLAYLSLPDGVLVLKWKLDLAMRRGELSNQQRERRDEQRAWMRKYVKGRPKPTKDGTHDESLQRLEKRLDDPLCVVRCA